jgi:hypothetical protein
MTLNQNGRRQIVKDEYNLFDNKARISWEFICNYMGWEIIKNKEDYFEDYVCKVKGTYYPMELQVAAYWHNHSIEKISNFYISKSKIDLLRNYVDKWLNVQAGLVFMNCVPNKFATINIKDISDDCLFKNDKGELFYKIPVNGKFNYFTSGLIDAKCDCEENHLEIMQRSKGRMRHLQKNYNIRGFNGICCR